MDRDLTKMHQIGNKSGQNRQKITKDVEKKKRTKNRKTAND